MIQYNDSLTGEKVTYLHIRESTTAYDNIRHIRAGFRKVANHSIVVQLKTLWDHSNLFRSTVIHYDHYDEESRHTWGTFTRVCRGSATPESPRGSGEGVESGASSGVGSLALCCSQLSFLETVMVVSWERHGAASTPLEREDDWTPSPETGGGRETEREGENNL